MKEFLSVFEKRELTEAEANRKKLIILIAVIAAGVLVAAGIAYLVYKIVERRAETELEDEELSEEDLFEEEEE